MKKQIVFAFAFILIVVILPGIAFSQPPPPPPPPQDTEVPFDGGLSILIAAGVGYGVKRIKSERKKK